MKALSLFLGTLALTGCARAFDYKRSYSSPECDDTLPYPQVIRELIKTQSYPGYSRRRLVFKPEITKNYEGLYFLIISPKKTHYNAWVPCIVMGRRALINNKLFMGEPEDTTGFTRITNSAIQYLGNSFNQAELDSIKSVFLYGGQPNLKPGHSVYYR